MTSAPTHDCTRERVPEPTGVNRAGRGKWVCRPLRHRSRAPWTHRGPVAAVDVDSTLRQLRAQLGAAEPPSWPTPSFAGPVAAPAEWSGDARDSADNRSRQLDKQRQAIADAHGALGPINQSAARLIAAARSQLDDVVAQWNADKARLAPVAGTPAGKQAVLEAGSIRVGQAKAIIAQTHTQFVSLAGQVSAATDQLPASGAEVKAVDFRHGPLPEAPGPDPAYPVNDIIAEAYDLDGNLVILRRGYYDAATGEGFGWDKIHWKHGLLSPRVFQDLISHSRPKTKIGGTLEYDVPIKKTHCDESNCTDIGELTMRIVVNASPSSPDVPQGGMKGVITMYPLPGGTDVVEVRPNWTLVPPWVNRNVPIN